MEKRYKIGLFFVLILISVLVAVLMWKRHTMDGFPNEGARAEQDQDGTGELSGVDDQAPKTAEEIYNVQKMNALTTADTVCIYENIDKKDGSMSVEVGKLPAKYVGLNRTELEELLAEDSLAPTLAEKQKGFKSQHLELFSAEKIKVLRIYDTTKDTTGFYIMEVDGEVCVYEHDRTTLYFKTGLRTDQLPADVRYELKKGKFMDSELQVYHFIESYSS
ncbi:MAG: hypothetical protein HFH75_13245 [Lachnospiraceae bacterium]|nr:hypothetical protein [Lachnospiraceae bacterium]MDE6940362.1 hypothetical protein [Lachnospiraceae bacterium]